MAETHGYTPQEYETSEDVTPKSEQALFKLLEITPQGFLYDSKTEIITDVYSEELSCFSGSELNSNIQKYSGYLNNAIDIAVNYRRFPDSVRNDIIQERVNRLDDWLKAHPVYGKVYNRVNPDYFERIARRLQRIQRPRLTFTGFCEITGYEPTVTNQ